jgi:hypothetical protein
MYSLVEIDISPDFTTADDIIKCIHYAMTPNRGGFSTPAAWPGGLNFLIGSWQSGDFPHLYAAVATELTSAPPKLPCAILVLQAEGFGVGMLKNDWDAALGPVARAYGGDVNVFYTSARSKNRMVDVMGRLNRLPAADFIGPYDATFLASQTVKNMTQGQPLTPVWADITRNPGSPEYADYAAAAAAFVGPFFRKMGIDGFVGRPRFVCLWGRTSGMRVSPTDVSPGRPLGGANPQYDSSTFGNEQLAKALYAGVGAVSAILAVGDGFNSGTLNLPYVFDLGAFWLSLGAIRGRFKENGFFDFLSATYNMDVVHVGMKSGGMDTLGLWGQKVVFVESRNAPAIVRGRVGAWGSPTLRPVEVGQLPTSTGKAIESLRAQKGDEFIKTSLDERQWGAVERREDSFQDGFDQADLDLIVGQVRMMFS